MGTERNEATSLPTVQAMPRVLHTVESAADLLSISRTRMYALIKASEIHSVRVGRLRRVPDEALAEFVSRLTAQQNAA